MMKPNEALTLYINQGNRDCTVLAVMGDKAIGEYVMPAGSTALVFLKRDAAGVIQMVGGVSYRACPRKWIKAIKDAGMEWTGNGQQGGRRSWDEAVASLPKDVTVGVDGGAL